MGPGASKGCWTCKQRKIACDRQRPFCQVCRASGRRCLGYSLKLSWPRDGDRKRAMVLPPGLLRRAGQDASSDARGAFVHVSSVDVELYQALSESTSVSAPLAFHSYSAPQIRPNPRWPPFPSKTLEINLFAYYQTKIAPRLVGVDYAAMQNLVFRMSFTDTSPASASVLLAIYTLTCLFLADPESTKSFHTKAVAAIQQAILSPDDTYSLRQYMAIALLIVFQILASTSPMSGMTLGFCPIGTRPKMMFTIDHVYGGDEALVLEYCTYTNFLAQFSTRHNSNTPPDIEHHMDSRHFTTAAMHLPRQHLIQPGLACSLEVFSTISSTLNTTWDIELGSETAKVQLEKLERRLKYARQEIVEPHGSMRPAREIRYIQGTAELQRLSGLIYLYRVGKKTASSHPVLQELVRNAFRLLEELKTCKRTFCLFVVGCEASTDYQRALVLKVAHRTKTDFLCTVMMRTGQYLERFWALSDLDIDNRLDHGAKMTAAASISKVPAFL